MAKAGERGPADPGISKLKLALGAASLFLFIVGLKRTFKVEAAASTPEGARNGAGPGSEAGEPATAGIEP